MMMTSSVHQQRALRVFMWTSILLLPVSLISICCHNIIADCLPPLLVVLTYMTFCSYSYFKYKLTKNNSTVFSPIAKAVDPEHAYCIAYASQTGYAVQLAEKTAQVLQQAGTSVVIVELNQLSLADLQRRRQMLFIVSTTGEGDAPDNADLFTRKLLNTAADLSTLRYAILALGDRHYQHYCAFGYRLAQWLQQQQAISLFDLVDVDNGDEAALRHWQHYLGKLSGHSEPADWNQPVYTAWTLRERRLLNPDSLGAPVFYLRLTQRDSLEQQYQWQAGDIAEIMPQYIAAPLTATEQLAQQKNLPHREYSIASIPQDGYLDLVVRQVRHPGGSLGLGSGWLTAHAKIGQSIALRIRSNFHFHTPLDDSPLILIGNGAGIAGLRAHLKTRQAHGLGRNWLCFGERQQARDFFFSDEILHWQNSGVLSKLSLSFSRDRPQAYYVQHALKEQATELRQWVAQGAVIMVCGSLKGMGEDVHNCLCNILTQETMDQLIADHRYRRDVY
ncbi:sulfite reductase subunit alpha [Undibacterium sp. RuRC25W]|uniref:sulfite reductase subunit alpha n=1 Tax=Undibacterium sp. RuRC25W TaxID=3413047 RepID=UPI003BF06302